MGIIKIFFEMFFAKSAIAASLASEEIDMDNTVASAAKFGFPSHMWTQYTQTGKGAGWGVEVGNQRIVMRSWKNKRVSMNHPVGNGLMANRGAVGPWEKFYVHSLNGANFVGLKANNGRWVTCEANTKRMTSNRVGLGPWEKFLVINHGIGASLKSIHNTFVVAERNGVVNCNRGAIGPWEKFYGW